jgi:hypothetical protein
MGQGVLFFLVEHCELSSLESRCAMSLAIFGIFTLACWCHVKHLCQVLVVESTKTVWDNSEPRYPTTVTPLSTEIEDGQDGTQEKPALTNLVSGIVLHT